MKWLIKGGVLEDIQELSEDCGALRHEPLDECVAPAGLEDCERAAAIFRALGDVNRLRLLTVLAARELCVSDLTSVLQDNLPAISQRLKLLRAERLVKTRRQGKHVFYSLSDEHIAELIDNGLAHAKERATS